MAFRLLLISTLIFFSGCTSLNQNLRPQSFNSYEDFWPGPEGGVDLVWATRDLRTKTAVTQKLLSYDNVIIDRVWLVLDKEANYDNISHGEVKALADYLIEQLERRISKSFTVVKQPTEKTFRISLAITNIETPNPILTVTSSILPFGIGISAVSEVVTGEPTNVGAATIELKVSDAISDKPLFAAIDNKSGEKRLSGIFDSTSDVRDAIDFWVDRLGHTLKDEAPKWHR
ncbi:DUF3313 domain-containing protein [Ferrimonas lipolytica]|uniref:DUF3313 domain-containing protein n=1 Tax=Ferrimonas lipolytica TaxID=2724191 RepID=A0A6H1UI07_9GAMM|nr:DUF3313 domain-containing protein [Ferrimonas lipolytica]QIZ78240.1 DUF3313 domain-containing protein [Ferrimonas lipolytica]